MQRDFDGDSCHRPPKSWAWREDLQVSWNEEKKEKVDLGETLDQAEGRHKSWNSKWKLHYADAALRWKTCLRTTNNQKYDQKSIDIRLPKLSVWVYQVQSSNNYRVLEREYVHIANWQESQANKKEDCKEDSWRR